MTIKHLYFDKTIIKRYDAAAPRYTSYPTAAAFVNEFSEADYRYCAEVSNESLIPSSLSLYFHIPFCDTVCFYCACNKIVTKDRSKSERYLSYLFREMEMHAKLYDKDRVVEQLHLGGGTPTFLSIEQLRLLFNKVRQSFNVLETDNGDYSIEIDPRSVTVSDIGQLRDMGFNRFSLGIQDVEPKVQQAINRVQPIEQTNAILQACRDNQVRSINVDLIYGLPHQSPTLFANTIDYIIDISPDRIALFNYAHLPNRFKPQRRIKRDDLPSMDQKLDILQQSIKQLTEAGYVYIGMDHFAKPTDELAIARQQGTLHRNFQGYTTKADCDLIAMGVSSISSIGTRGNHVCSYSQNYKTLDRYYQALDQQQLPIEKGVMLDSDDLLRRHVIQQLTCYDKLVFKVFEEAYHIQFSRYFKRELSLLKPMQDDGLLAITETTLTILPRGRLLLRNICTAFDVGLRKMTTEQRFSKAI